MSRAKRAELASRTLTDREVSDIRALCATGSHRDVVRLVEHIVADHCAEEGGGMRYTSSDGLLSSSDPAAVATWERIGAEQASEQARWSALLRSMGIKLEHPDDGWVNRERNTITPSYPRFDLRPGEGDLIALGSPSRGYRLVRCTQVTHGGILAPTTTYHFEDTARRVSAEAIS